MICKMCNTDCNRTSNRQLYCSKCSKINKLQLKRHYEQSPKAKQQTKEYNQRPEVKKRNKERIKKHRLTPEGKQYVKSYNAQYRTENKEALKQRYKSYYAKNADKIIAKINKQNKELRTNPETREAFLLKIRKQKQKHNKTPLEKKKDNARLTAYRHVKMPKGQPCEDCNNKPAEQKHHPNYDKPLEVIFLCKECHKARHKKHKPIEKEQ